MIEKNNSSILNKVFSDTAILLALIPFSFTLIVFMYQVGKFFFYDIPLLHISISLGELFSFWFGFFIAVGVIGFGFLNFIVSTILKFKLARFFKAVLFEPLVYALMIFLLMFPIAEFEATLILSSAAILILFINLIDAWSNKNKQLNFFERIESNRAKSKYKSKVTDIGSTNWWDKLNEKYFLGFFCAYVILGVPCKVGYLLESTKTRHWVDSSNHELLLIQAQNEFHLLKEYDPIKKTLKAGYIIRPVAEKELGYLELEIGEIKKLKDAKKGKQ